MFSIGIVIIIAIVFLLLCSSNGRGKNGKQSGTLGRPTRIDHLHYFDADDHECSVCGARFRGKSMTCPKCGARFTGTKEDDGEFIEEMELWDDDDD